MSTGTRKRHLTRVIIAGLFALCLSMIYFKVEARAQQPSAASAERELGVTLYNQGDIKGAVKALRAAVKQDKTDADAWYYLSLALSRNEDLNGARKAAQTSVSLRPSFAPARAGLAYLLMLSNKVSDALREAEAALSLDYQNAEANYVMSVVSLRKGDPTRALEAIEAALKYKPDFEAALLLKSQVLLTLYAIRTDFSSKVLAETRAQRLEDGTTRLQQAADSLEKYFQLNPTPPDAAVWREQLATLRLFSENTRRADPAKRTVFLSDELTTKARILSRPEPQYTDKARSAGIEGTVILRAVFALDGTVKHIIVLQSLPHGLTEKALKAARKIKFIPATIEGRPVSQFIQIEYNFNLY